MHIKILGSGCKKCIALADNTKSAAQASGVDVEIEKVTDIVAISGYGVMSTPSLVLDEKVVSTGRVLTVDEISRMLKEV
ncbi:MAG: small redox-active disulfide protein 2 [Ascidiaceihabitans sp.]|jgi:small redox-active disulfide protein 2